MKKVLVLCTGNSCRSQIAEGYRKHFAGDKAAIFSAGVETHGVNPAAIATMAEAGIDISGHTSNHITEYAGIDFDYVITVCDNARELCPVFPSGAMLLHENFPDPAKATGTPTEVKAQFSKVREMIRLYTKDIVAQYL